MEDFSFDLTLREQVSLDRLRIASALATPGSFLTHAVAVLDAVVREGQVGRTPYVFGQDGLYETSYKIDPEDAVDRLMAEFAKRQSRIEFKSGPAFAQQLDRVADHFATKYQTPRSRTTAAALAIEFAVCVEAKLNHSQLDGGYLACVREGETRGTIMLLPYDQRLTTRFMRAARLMQQKLQRKMAPVLGVR